VSNRPIQKVETGTWARIRGYVQGEEAFEEVYHFVPSNEVNLIENRISVESPLGRAMSGVKAGDNGQLDTKTGKMKFEVLEVGRT